MSKETKRSAEMRRVLAEFQAGGFSRQEFGRQRSIPLTTFDYWRWKHAVKKREQARRPRLVAVRVANAKPGPQFTLSLANGRRIVIRMLVAVGDAELARLIRIAESTCCSAWGWRPRSTSRWKHRYAQGIEGLHGLVRDHLGQDRMNGHLFLFTNKGKEHVT